jgi:transposase InsO family protein
MELADLSSISKHNNKYKYLLNVIDMFSRCAWSVQLKVKSATSVFRALKALFLIRKPITQQSHKHKNKNNFPNTLLHAGAIVTDS